MREVRKGMLLVISGPSGAGKSTFAKLVMRFYDPTSGSITVDGIDLKDMSLFDLHKNLGSVPQYPVLFNDTIYNNILLARPDATKEEIEAAAKYLKANPGLFGPSACFIDPNRFEEIARSVLQAARNAVGKDME